MFMQLKQIRLFHQIALAFFGKIVYNKIANKTADSKRGGKR